MTYLLQHLRGEAKRSVQEFTNDKVGYIAALQRLKYIFGQKSKVAQAQLWKVIHDKSISNDDNFGRLYMVNQYLMMITLEGYT